MNDDDDDDWGGLRACVHVRACSCVGVCVREGGGGGREKTWNVDIFNVIWGMN
jgi:hypothetical protein